MAAVAGLLGEPNWIRADGQGTTLEAEIHPDAAEASWWHGGQDGLNVGDWIVPAAQLLTRPGAYAFGDEYPCDPHRVYITRDRQQGLGFSSQLSIAGGGALYRVEPAEPLEEDPDYAGFGVCFTTSRALIVAVEARAVWLGVHAQTHAMGRFMAWTDGTPLYDGRGRFLASPEMRALGITDEFLAGLGRWLDYTLAMPIITAAWERGTSPTADDVAAALAAPGPHRLNG